MLGVCLMTNNKFDFSVDKQLDILYFLLDKSIFNKYYRIVSPSFFTEYVLQDIFSVYKEFFIKYEDTPANSILKDLLNDFIAVSNKSITEYDKILVLLENRTINVNYIEDELKEFIRNTAVKLAVKAAYTRIGTSEDKLMVSNIEKALAITSNIDEDDTYDYKERFESRRKLVIDDIRIANAVPTLIPTFDMLTKGGAGAGELITVIARSGAGKSVFLVNIARGAILTNKNVLYITLELTATQIARRLDSCICNYAYEEVKNKLDKIEYRLGELAANVKIKYWPARSISVSEIKEYIKQLQRKTGFTPDILIIDFAEYLTSTYTEERFRIKDIYANLKGLAGFFQIPVYNAHQASVVKLKHGYTKDDEEIEDTSVLTSDDISEAKVGVSGQSDFVLSLNQTQKERDNGTMRLWLEKVRDAPGKITIYMKYEQAKFRMTEIGKEVKF